MRQTEFNCIVYIRGAYALGLYCRKKNTFWISIKKFIQQTCTVFSPWINDNDI